MVKEVLCELTKNCNLKQCKHCYLSLAENKDKVFENLSTEKWIEIFDILVNAGFTRCILLGGEPTLHQGFYTLLEYASEKFEEVVVETNGCMVSEFSKFDCAVSVSFEYGDPERNDDIRGSISFKDKKVGVFELGFRKLKTITNPKIMRFTAYADSDILLNATLAEKLNSNSAYIPLIGVGSAINMKNSVPGAKKLLGFYENI